MPKRCMLFGIYLGVLVLTGVSVSSLAFQQGQNTRQAAKPDLSNTTWQMYSRGSNLEPWKKYMVVTFLPDGIVEELTAETGYKCRGGKWKVVGQKVRIIEGDIDCAPALVKRLDASIQGGQMTGTADLGMNPRGSYVQLVRQDVDAIDKTSSKDTIVMNGVRVKDFYKANEGNYDCCVVLLSGTNTIQFDKNRGTFRMTVIATTPSEFKRNRRIVENQFLRILGIAQTDACKLQVTLTKNAPGAWDGIEYRPSFCK